MCTLVFAWQVFETTPLAVAANRDEALDRPAEPPGVYQTDPRVIAPRDASAGGTWIGYNAHGLFVAITNRWVDLAGERSRGVLVADALAASSATAAVDVVREAVAADTYAGFTLVVADDDRAALLEYDGELRVTDLTPGVHVVVNVGADGRFFEPDSRPEVGRQQAKNAEAVRAALRVGDADEPRLNSGADLDEPRLNTDADFDEPRLNTDVNLDDAGVSPLPTRGGDDLGPRDERAIDWLARAARVLGDHDVGVCVHGDGFGTRSASLIALGRAENADNAPADNPPADRYWFADGPPCRTRFERVESRL